MPIYEFRCRRCGHMFERLMPLDSAPPPCPSCERPAAERLVSVIAARVAESGGAAGCGCGACTCGSRAN